MKQKISCIIAAYNEGKRIKNVLRVVVNCKSLSEIIVVNDGSKDNTLQVIKDLKKKNTHSKIKIITYPDNHGKAYALKCAIDASKGDILLFLDADLTGLDNEAINRLTTPVLSGIADMSLSFRISQFYSNLLFNYPIGADPLSGERAVRKSCISGFKGYENSRFGFEVLLNKYFISKKYKIIIVPLSRLRSTLKKKKMGFIKGLKCEIKMRRQILKCIPFKTLVGQYLKFRKFPKSRS